MIRRITRSLIINLLCLVSLLFLVSCAEQRGDEVFGQTLMNSVSGEVKTNAWSGLKGHPGFENAERKNYDVEFRRYSSAEECSVFKNASSSPMLSKIREQVSAPFLIACYDRMHKGEAALGGAVLVFLDESSRKVFGVYPVV